MPARATSARDLSDDDLIAAWHASGGAPPSPAEFDARFAGEPEASNPWLDVAKSFGTGVARGTAALVGLPGDVQSGMDWLGRKAGSAIFGEDPARDARVDAAFGKTRLFPTSAEVRQAASNVTGLTLPEPTTTAGKYAETVGEFVPSVLGGRTLASLGERALPAVGRTLADLARYAAAPGVASEAAGQAFEGTAAEPYARVGAAVATGGLAALTARPGTARAALREAIPRSTTSADVSAARSLMEAAQQRGVQLTWPEALARVTGGRVDMTDVQRVLEQSPGGRPVMSEFMARRPRQVQDAAAAEFDRIAPQAAPVRTGLDVQQASAAALNGLRNRINAVTRPLYRAAGPASIDPKRFKALSADPLFESALRVVREDPVYGRALAGKPDNSVAVFDAVKKHLDDLASDAGRSGRNFAAASYGDVAGNVRKAATDASPQYAQALQRQAQLRDRVLGPAEAGPLGRMSETANVRQQFGSLLPENPVAGSEKAVGQAVRQLVRRNPDAARQLVRSHLATAFDEATQATVAGANQWGGAKAAAKIIGNRQQERNLQAAIEALPAGPIRWRGMKELMEVLSATGARQRPGSMTEFNRQISGDMTRGGVTGTSAALALSPNRLVSFVSDFYQRFRLGQNTRALAEIITQPGNEKLLSRLIAAKSLTEKQRAAALILYNAQDQARGPRGKSQ
jgi:hypothetical protein